MSASDPGISPPLPPRLVWFAPWRWFAHWRPWKRWTLAAVILLAGYVELPVLLIIAAHYFGIAGTPPVEQFIQGCLWPIAWCSGHSRAVEAFYVFQLKLFGVP